MARRAVAVGGSASTSGAGAVLISPRTSCNCCFNNMVDEEICSQVGSDRPDVLAVDQEMTERGLPKGGLFWCWPIKWARKPWTTDRADGLINMRISDRRLRPCSPKKLRFRWPTWMKRRSI